MIFVFYLSLIQCIKHPYSLELDKNNIFQYVGTNQSVFIHFYADLCQHCIKIAPEWNEVVRIYKPLGKYIFATVDCDRSKSICSTLDSTSTPDFQYFQPHSRRGDHYGGERNIIHFVKWIKGVTGDIPYNKPWMLLFIKEGDHLKEINDFLIKENKYVFTVVDSPRKPYYNHTVFRNVETFRDDIVFRAVSIEADEGMKICGSTEKRNCMVLLHEDQKVEYNGDVNEDKIFDFLDLNVKDEL